MFLWAEGMHFMLRRTLFLGLCALPVIGYFALRDRNAPPEDNQSAQEIKVKIATPAPVPLTDADVARLELLAGMTFVPGQAFPAALPWQPLREVGLKGGFPLEHLLRTRPVEFLQMSLDRYEREVEGYRLIFRKRERIAGKLYPAEKDKYETVEVHFREKPFSVHFNWLKEPKLAQKVLYVEGENDGKMLARPRGLLGALVVSRDVDGADAKASGRYTIDQFGLQLALRRTVANMRKAQARDKLFVEYQGLVTLPAVGDRPCYKFVRTPYDPPDEDGINELTLYIDQETWLQVGSVLKDAQGNLIAEYYFSDIELNPDFPASQFTRGAI